jgi:hypothetical protein
MKKKKNVVIEPVFNETVSVNNDMAKNASTTLEVRKWDSVDLSISMQSEGWVFGDPAVKEALRQIMHDKVDRQIDRVEYNA